MFFGFVEQGASTKALPSKSEETHRGDLWIYSGFAPLELYTESEIHDFNKNGQWIIPSIYTSWSIKPTIWIRLSAKLLETLWGLCLTLPRSILEYWYVLMRYWVIKSFIGTFSSTIATHAISPTLGTLAISRDSPRKPFCRGRGQGK